MPLILVAVACEVFCLVDVFRSESVRYLPRWAWAVICRSLPPTLAEASRAPMSPWWLEAVWLLFVGSSVAFFASVMSAA